MDRTAIWAGVIAGAAVSGYFMWREVQTLQSPAYARSIEPRVAVIAERAVMQHLTEGYGLSPDRIASIVALTRTMGIR